MYYDYDDLLKLEMQSYREQALKKISKVVKPAYAEDFAQILFYSWQENFEKAESLSEDLDLYPIDFISLFGNVKEFEEQLINEKNLQVEFYA